jgi:hypothetical protein
MKRLNMIIMSTLVSALSQAIHASKFESQAQVPKNKFGLITGLEISPSTIEWKFSRSKFDYSPTEY